MVGQHGQHVVSMPLTWEVSMVSMVSMVTASVVSTAHTPFRVC